MSNKVNQDQIGKKGKRKEPSSLKCLTFVPPKKERFTYELCSLRAKIV